MSQLSWSIKIMLLHISRDKAQLNKQLHVKTYDKCIMIPRAGDGLYHKLGHLKG